MILSRATLGLGGNIGTPRNSMAQALQMLDASDDCAVLAVSRLYRTPPWGKVDQDWYVNACAEIATQLSPLDLLDLCLSIERSMKRERTERWGPRTLDIDILTYGETVLHTDRLTLPHPRMTERGFVLMPLQDIAPDLQVNGRPVREWLQLADLTWIELADPDPQWWRSMTGVKPDDGSH